MHSVRARSAVTAALLGLALTVPSSRSQAEAPALLGPTEVGAQGTVDLSFAASTARTTTDVYPATATNPRPLAKALSQAVPGQQIVVHGGVYREHLATSRAGTPTAPIWLVEAIGETVVLKPDGVSDQPVLRLRHPYWVARGFEMSLDRSKVQAVRVDNTDHVLVERLDAYGGTANAGVVFVGARQTALRDSRVHDFAGGGQESHGVLVTTGSDGVLLQGNDGWGNSGDSVQCAHDAVEPSDTPAAVNVTISGNHFGNLHLDGRRTRSADFENAVDVKSCANVTVHGNAMMGYHGTASSPGTAVVAHYRANRVLIEDNAIWDCGQAASLGAVEHPGLGSVVFRRNLVADAYQAAGAPTPLLGRGVRVAPAQRAEIYENSFFRIPGQGPAQAGNTAVVVGDTGTVGLATVVHNLVVGTGGGIQVRNSPGATAQPNHVWHTPLG